MYLLENMNFFRIMYKYLFRLYYSNNSKYDYRKKFSFNTLLIGRTTNISEKKSLRQKREEAQGPNNNTKLTCIIKLFIGDQNLLTFT